MRDIKIYLDKAVSLVLIAAILAVSCTMSTTGPGELSAAVLISAAGRAIDEQLSTVMQYVEQDLDEAGLRGMFDDIDGYDVARNAYGEENGRQYLEFCLYAGTYESVDEVLEAASTLAPAEGLDDVRKAIDDVETRFLDESSEYMRMLTASEKKEYYSDVTKLLVKTAVLLTATVVYAYIPTAVVWGKIAAAAAVATVAGLVAATLLAIIQKYKTDSTTGETFTLWLETVTTEPAAAVAIAASVFSLGTSLGRSTVCSAIILGIFSLVGIVDDVKELLTKYNFTT